MKSVVFNETVEHRFVHGADEEVQPLNEIAQKGAVKVSEADVPDTDLKASVWRIPHGAECNVPDKDAEKLGDHVSPSGTAPRERPRVVAPDPADQNDRTPLSEAERQATEAGHTKEGQLIDHDRHVQFARGQDMAPGGDAARTEARRIAEEQLNPPAQGSGSGPAAQGAPGPSQGAPGPSQGGPAPGGRNQPFAPATRAIPAGQMGGQATGPEQTNQANQRRQ